METASPKALMHQVLSKLRTLALASLALYPSLFTLSAHAETMATGKMGQCQGAIEYNAKAQALGFRLAHGDTFYCGASQEETLALLNSALKALPEGAQLDYLSIGRLIDYDWIGAALVAQAAQDKNWNAAQARPESQAGGAPNTYAYVSAYLSGEPLVSVWNDALRSRSVEIDAASIEKLLISGPDVAQNPAWVPSQKGYPFDAILHYRLRPLHAPITTE
ncbi:hypothetical protein EUZ85_25995 [Hahella sp. KA22]|uniref:hypothetical protein n=1 Tax=Hahella sp. KA22 TaxID=1628392 RepID=UPI000FDE6788|nr:hypothetical protein [Hahella sp. KA22]AZZ93989.1 hypothetical protein ENC22_23410 [Hahella sp. KA22]QAY57363.1 hypothetical protein EUZ85_25995 [Hahella sp. KA22]